MKLLIWACIREKMKTKKKEEERRLIDKKSVKFGYGVPRSPSLLKDLRRLRDLPQLRDPRVSVLRKRKKKYLLREKEEQSYYTEMTGIKLNPNIEYVSEYGMRAKDFQSMEGSEEELIHDKDYFLAEAALEHYNRTTKGAKYKLVKCLGHYSKFVCKYTSHCNFIAECTDDSSTVEPKLELLFAEVIGLQEPEVSICDILEPSHLCYFCPKEIAHPADASWPSPASYFS